MSGNRKINYGRKLLGWSEAEYLNGSKEAFEINPEFLYLLDCLFATHVGVDNDYEEPYKGVMALFNGDQDALETEPTRAEWEVVSPYELRRLS